MMSAIQQNNDLKFGVIFDMDGVIFDTQKLIFEAEKIIFNELNLQISDTEHFKYAGKTSWELWKTIKKKYQLQKSLDELVLNHRSFGFKYIKQKGSPPIQGVSELLNSLVENGIKIALATSGWKTRADWMLENAGLKKFFSTIVYGDDVKNSKPAPDIFLLAAKKIDIDQQRCFVIEDSCNGIQAAKAAGMIALGFQNPHSHQNLHTADLIFKDFSQLNFSGFKKIVLDKLNSSSTKI